MPPKTPPINRNTDSNTPCPCGSQQSLQACCLDFIEGTRLPPTAESLMRSRYTAHSLVAVDYLWDTWSPEQRLRSSKSDIRAWAESCDWLGLQIRNTHAGAEYDDSGIVEFVAIFRQQGQLHQHHETSLFRKHLGKWFYVDHVEP
jgi:SEC-C motif-containing protein